MGKRSEYVTALLALRAGGWESYLAARSGLPGPRGNLELLHAVADAALGTPPEGGVGTCGCSIVRQRRAPATSSLDEQAAGSGPGHRELHLARHCAGFGQLESRAP